VVDNFQHADDRFFDDQRHRQQRLTLEAGLFIGIGGKVGRGARVVNNHRSLAAHGLAHHTAAGRQAFIQQVASRRTRDHPEDQFIGLRIDQQQAAGLAAQYFNCVLQNGLQQGLGLQGGGELAGHFVQRRKLAGTALGFAQQAGLGDGPGHLVGGGLQQAELLLRIGHIGVAVAQTEGANCLRAGVERYAHPGVQVALRQHHPAPLTFFVIVIRHGAAALPDHFLFQRLARRNDDIFLFVQALIIFDEEHLHQFFALGVVQHQVELVRRDDLGRLGVGQLIDIIQRNGNVHTLGHAGQDVHFLHAALQVINHLGALNRQCRLVAEGFQEVEFAGSVGVAGMARPQRQPACQPLPPGQRDEQDGVQQVNAGLFGLQRGGKVDGAAQVERGVLVAQRLHQPADRAEAQVGGRLTLQVGPGGVLLVQRVKEEDVQMPRLQRVFDVAAQHPHNVIQVHGLGQIAAEGLERFLVGARAAEEQPVNQMLQALAQRQNQQRQYEENQPEENRHVGRQQRAQPQAQARDQQGIAHRHQHRHGAVEQRPAEDVIGVEQAVALNGIAARQREDNQRDKEVGREVNVAAQEGGGNQPEAGWHKREYAAQQHPAQLVALQR